MTMHPVDPDLASPNEPTTNVADRTRALPQRDATIAERTSIGPEGIWMMFREHPQARFIDGERHGERSVEPRMRICFRRIGGCSLQRGRLE